MSIKVPVTRKDNERWKVEAAEELKQGGLDRLMAKCNFLMGKAYDCALGMAYDIEECGIFLCGWELDVREQDENCAEEQQDEPEDDN